MAARFQTLLALLLWASFPQAGIVCSAADPPTANRPAQVREGTAVSPDGYVSSSQCQSCHLPEYASWHRSFHRTMTQVVSVDSVIADFDAGPLELDGRRYALERRGDEFWVDPPDGDPAQIVQSTGSHHYQLYWYPSGIGRELTMLPFVFLKDEARWVPRRSVFLEPPGLTEERLAWNVHCLPCHSTDGRPGYSGDPASPGPDTRVAEVGIACEACHGPGRDHAASHRDGSADPAALVHPRRIEPSASAQVCGQCHSVNVPYTREAWVDWLLDGPTFRPGEQLDHSRLVVQPSNVNRSTLIQGWIRDNPDTLAGWFWPDGMVRVTGREYNGLIESPCYSGGRFSCVSCHSQHQGEPDDLLTPAMRGDQACRQCHQWSESRIAAHTHHQPESSGSRCSNCHMPHTTYGLLKASRSHTIDSPTVRTDLEAGRPNACNLCHLDRTLAWTATHLQQWYGIPAPAIAGDHASVAASVKGLLQGDAGLRALYGWHFGWGPAQSASGDAWIAPILAEGLNDSYDVVRYIASRSLRTLPGFEDFAYDFVSSAEVRAAAVARVRTAWRERGADASAARAAVLQGEQGVFLENLHNRLLSRRDNRPVRLRE